MCTECDPPSEWVHLVPHTPRSVFGRGFWFAARAVVAWWEQAVDTARTWRRR